MTAPDTAERRAHGEAVPILVGSGAAFDGLIELPGPGRIDGRVRGEVLATGALWLGPEAEVSARITAPEIVIEGVLEGDVRASGRVELRSTARVTARLRTPRLVLNEGSFFEGECCTSP